MARLTNIGISSAEVARALKDDEVWAEAVLREWRGDCARWPDASGAVPMLTALKNARWVAFKCNYMGNPHQLRPLRAWWGATGAHPEPCWLLDCIDFDEHGALTKSFACHQFDTATFSLYDDRPMTRRWK
jgi:hypothetical protein